MKASASGAPAPRPTAGPWSPFHVRAATLAFGAGVGLLVGVAWLSFRTTNTLLEAAGRSEHTQTVLVEIRGLLGQVLDAETGARGFVITEDERFLEPYRRAVSEFPRRLQALRLLTQDNPRQRRRLDLIDPLARARLDRLDALVSKRREQGFAPAGMQIATMKGKRIMDEIRDLLSQMEAEENGLAAERDRALSASARTTRLTLLVTATLSVGLFVGVFLALDREVGRRRHANLAEARHATILRSILESMADGVVVADREGRFLLFNPAAERILGLGATDTAPAQWSQRYRVFRPDGVTPYPPEELPLTRAIRGETSNADEQVIRNPRTAREAILSVSGTPLVDRSGGLLGGVVVFREVTEAKRAEAALRAAKEAAEAASRELEAFSYSVSHDLRAPLRAIDGFSQAVFEDYGQMLEAAGRDHLDRIRKGAQRMAHLIDDILGLSRITRAELVREAVDLSSLAGIVAGELSDREPARRVRLEIEDGLMAEGDPRLLRVALENLLGNAWKFTRNAPSASIQFGASQAGGETTYFVRDNGAGFDMAYADKLFGAFQRLHGAREFEGTGVGLATVARVIRRHGGRIWAAAEVGLGATFYFTLGTPGALREARREAQEEVRV